MARRRRISKAINSAQTRLAGLKSLDPALDLGNGLTLTAFKTVVSGGMTNLSTYNQALATIDDLYNALRQSEKDIGDMSERMLAGVAVRYGKTAHSTSRPEACARVNASGPLGKLRRPLRTT